MQGKSALTRRCLRYASHAMSNANDDRESAAGYGAPPLPSNTNANRPVPTSSEQGSSRKLAVGAVIVLVIAVLIALWIRSSIERQRNEALEVARQAQRTIEQQQATERSNTVQPTVQAPVVPVVQQPSPAALASAAIASTMRTRIEEVGRRCFSIIEGADPSAYGYVSLRVSVDPVTGLVDIGRLNHGTLPTSFVACFRSQVERPAIAIPPGPSAGAPVEVRWEQAFGTPPVPH